MKRLGAVAVAALLVAPSAFAQDELEPANRARDRDPNAKLAIDVRFGAYRPQVDSAFSSAHPYADVFGDKTRFMVGLEADWQPVHIPHVGSLGLGGIFAYTRAGGTAQFEDGSTGSDEETHLSIYNFAAVATIRIDVLARETWIPIVPFARVGPAVSLWESSNQQGTSRAPDGTLGRGRTHGWLYAFGGMFMLDALDRRAAKTFAAEQGVKHTYFFFEYSIWDMRGVGQSNVLRTGDTTWTIGLSFEM